MKLRYLLLTIVLVVIGLPVMSVLVCAGVTAFYDRGNQAMVSSGMKREFLLHVPPSYDRSKPAPLVISIHAAAVWPSHQMGVSHWNEVADEHGFIVVYPGGTGTPKIWPMDGDALTGDVKFISDLIDTLEAAYNIDPARVYADGLSNGGGMVFALSCTLSDRIAAVGAVAAAELLPWSWCTDPRPVPMIAFHGTADPIVPYNGGLTWKSPTRRPFPSTPEWAASWARRNRCGAAPADSIIFLDIDRLEYINCADNAAVVLYTIHGGGHSWPGGRPIVEWWVGPTNREIDATRLIWAFFQEHPLRQKQRGGP